MLQFHGSAALERSHITVSGKSYRVPKADGRLNAQLVLEGGQVDLYDRAGQLKASRYDIGKHETLVYSKYVQRHVHLWYETIL